MGIIKKFLFLLIFIIPNITHSMFSLFTLENVIFALNNKNTLKNALKDIFDTSKNTVNKGLYALSIGLTSLGAIRLTYLTYNAYNISKKEKEEEVAPAVRSTWSELFFPNQSDRNQSDRNQSDRNLAKVSITSLVVGFGILGFMRKNQQK